MPIFLLFVGCPTFNTIYLDTKIKHEVIEKYLFFEYEEEVNFISTIGGREVKDNIHRCLKTIFTNDAATKCSWLGQRGNFRVCDLASITTLKDVIQSTYTITQKQFEVICSEWFRLAKLRIKPTQNQAFQL
ncbi:hypothetical protein RI129_007539 [Pyrocoelia pectoralis]|uniref:DUF4806 domain-containing protein n=1 Tax=Pyrocoelia pectoralis TaxID=417401 RepID=A0AAN7VGN6_9COLE